MADNREIQQHYTQDSLLQKILDGIAALGKSTTSLQIEDLAPVDEFHIGGRPASIEFLDQLDISAQSRVLDVGCGIGGASRFVATRYAATVCGIDLTADYIETARELNACLGLSDQIELHQGSALHTPFAAASFDRAYMMHVGMNIPDKGALFQEIARVLKAQAYFGVYDVMQIGDGDLSYPVPWATTADNSAVAKPADYCSALEAAGFAIEKQRDRREFALEFFAQLGAQAAAPDGPPPLGIHLLMGANAPQKRHNMVENIAAGRIAPVEIIARKVS